MLSVGKDLEVETLKFERQRVLGQDREIFVDCGVILVELVEGAVWTLLRSPLLALRDAVERMVLGAGPGGQ